MKNNNQAIIRRITGRTLSADKRRNFFIIAAITLTTFMIASVFSIGISYYESINMREKRMQGSVSQMAFNNPSEAQLEQIYSLDYVKSIGIGAYVAQTSDVAKLDNLDIGYVDKIQWEEMFCPTYTNIIGHYPEQDNEVMLSRYILDAMGISDPQIGMEIPLSYIVNGTDDVITETFILSCVYTEYASVAGNKSTAILTSRAFAEKYGKLTNDNLNVNIIFKDANRVGENIERLKQDLAFSENQAYVQSPAFDDNYGSAATYIVLFSITAFLMLTGYLLIYNVMYISISKDVRFYGMLKTLGTTPRQIRRIISGQILRLCVIGLPVGCAVSAVVSLLFVPAVLSTSGIDTGVVISFSPVIYVGAVIFAVLTALIGAITPAKKAANISPVEALKFTGEEIRKSGVYTSANGKSHKMALRNIFRDRKRAVVVLLSLFLGVAVFSSIMIVVTSIDIDYRINDEYISAFSLGCISKYPDCFLDEELIDRIKSLDGIAEIGITTYEEANFIYTEALSEYANWYVDWFYQEYNISRNISDVLNITLQGIDLLTLNRINEKFSTPIDAEAFERGEIALLRYGYYEGVIDSFANVTDFDIIINSNEKSFNVKYGGDANIKEPLFSNKVTAGREILVSNSLMYKYIDTPRIQYIDINVEDGCEEQIYNELTKIVPKDVEILSRYEARKALQDAKTITLVLGSGISAILGFIGIFNFINVISVGIVSRKRELATLESIGMSKNQMRSMLRNEGIGYAVITILFSLTLGNLISYGLFQLVKSIEETMQFTYPLVPVLFVYAVILLICIITPEIAYRGMSKTTLVERLREAE